MRLGKKVFILIFFLFVMIFYLDICFAEFTLTNLQGNQNSPRIYGRYIVFHDNKYVYVYDSGNAISVDDDIGVSELSYVGDVKGLAIDKRYVTWINKFSDSEYEIFVYDFGDDLIRDSGDETEIKKRKLGIVNEIDGKKYTKKENLEISGNIIVWQDYDEVSGDYDVRAYDTEKNEMIDISSEKVFSERGIDYKINEEDPYVVGDKIVFVKDFYVYNGSVEPSREIYEYNLVTKETKIVSSDTDECDAREPSINKQNKEEVVWLENCESSWEASEKVVKNKNLVAETKNAYEKYHSPVIFNGDVFYTMENLDDDTIKLSYVKNIDDFYIDCDENRLVYIVWNGKDRDVELVIRFYDENEPINYGNLFFPTANTCFSVASDGDGGAIIGYLYEYYDKEKSKYASDPYALFIRKDGKVWPDKPINLGDELMFNGLCSQSKDSIATVPDGNGGAIVIWPQMSFEGIRNNPQKDVIYAKFVRKDGTLKDVNDEVILTGKGIVRNRVSSLSANSDEKGGAVISFYSDSLEAGSGVYVLFLHSDGTYSKPLLIKEGEFFDLHHSAFDGNDGAIVSIRGGDMRNTNQKIFFGIKEGSNSLDWKLINLGEKVGAYSLVYPSGPSVTSDGDGGAIVTWKYYDKDPTRTSLISVFVDKNGDLKSGGPHYLLQDSTYQIEPDGSQRAVIESDNNGGAYIGWLVDKANDSIATGEYGLFLNRLLSDGSLLKKQPVSILKEPHISEKRRLLFLNKYKILSDENSGAYAFFTHHNSDINRRVFAARYLDSELNVKEFNFDVDEEEIFDFPNSFRGTKFVRGDVDGNGVLTLGDAVMLLGVLFSEQNKLICEDAADVDDNGVLTIGDAVYLLNFMFLNEGDSAKKMIKEPYPDQGVDLTGDDLACECYPKEKC